MNSPALTFRNNFLTRFDASEYSSLRALSLDADASPSRAHKIASGEFDNSQIGPGIFLVDRLARKMGCTPNDLLGYKKPAPAEDLAPAGKPTIERLTKCYVRSCGHINGFTDYLNFCQIYGEPKDNRINLISSGKLSLATIQAGTSDPAYLQEQFFKFPPERQASIYKGQRAAWDAGMGVAVENLDHAMADRGRRARFDFLRAAFRVLMPDGSTALLVYCELIDQ